MTRNIELPWKQEVVIHHTQRLLQSFQHWTGNCLLDASGSLEQVAQALFEAPFVLVRTYATGTMRSLSVVHKY